MNKNLLIRLIVILFTLHFVADDQGWFQMVGW